MISDGQSIGILKKDFLDTLFINSELDKQKLLQFQDYSASIVENYYINDNSEEKKFWEKYLSNINQYSIETPKDYDITEKNFSAWKEELIFEEREAKNIIQFCENESITLAMFFAGVSNLVISRWTKKEKFLVNMQVSGRNISEMENSFGYFVNTVYWPVDIPYGSSVSQFFQDTKKVFIKILNNQAFPDNKVESLFSIPQVPIFYNFIREEVSIIPEVSEFEFSKKYEGEFSVFNLIIETKKRKDNISVNFVYQIDLYKKETIKYLISEFQKTVNDILYYIIDLMKKTISWNDFRKRRYGHKEKDCSYIFDFHNHFHIV